jgi:hypothetical protein
VRKHSTVGAHKSSSLGEVFGKGSFTSMQNPYIRRLPRGFAKSRRGEWPRV